MARGYLACLISSFLLMALRGLSVRVTERVCIAKIGRDVLHISSIRILSQELILLVLLPRLHEIVLIIIHNELLLSSTYTLKLMLGLHHLHLRAARCDLIGVLGQITL